MTRLTQDPLLAIARGLLTFTIGVAGIIAAASLLAIPALFIWRTELMLEIAKEGVSVPTLELLWPVALALVIFAAIWALVVWFAGLLRQIVDSVADGDPFVPDNADRLRRMAWLALATQGLALALGAAAAWIESLAEKNDLDMTFSFSGVLVALILFILARVFRRGAAMREELEGTV